MEQCGYGRPDLNALHVTQLVAEGKFLTAARYLFDLHKSNVLLWSKTREYLLNFAYTNKLLNTYATIIEISCCDTIEQKAHLLPANIKSN